MKLAVAIASDKAPSNAFVVWRGFEASIEKAAEFGYQGVELALMNAREVTSQILDQSLSRAGIEVSCISTGQVFANSGLYFTHPNPDFRDRVVKVFKELIDLSADYGSMVNIGRIRGFFSKDEARGITESRFIEITSRLCDYAANKNVTLIIEPVNRYEINFLNSVPETARICRQIGNKNIGLMPDVFHMNIEDEHIGLTLYEYKDLIKYVHFADSNRLAPGRGHLNFSEIISSLRRSEYEGWISLEILPEPDPDTAAREAAGYILPLIAQKQLRDSA